MRAFTALAALLLVCSIVFASTTCQVTGCEINITIHIAVAGANQSYIDGMNAEIENVWNSGSPTTGDCKCRVNFDSGGVPVTALNKTNCTPPAPNYHCVEVTRWNGTDASLPSYRWPNGTVTYYTGYMGRTQPSPPQNGASTDGWWSDQMSRPVPGGAAGDHYQDFAHEAGHMLGLPDGSGGIMNFTSGANATPTQQNIDAAVANACGANACPDSCCCGNGIVEKSKGENCDPKASPSGCMGTAMCCPVCCSCYSPACDEGNGSYGTFEKCSAACAGGQCCQNYRTGCFDCVKQQPPVITPCHLKSNAQTPECGHEILHRAQALVELYYEYSPRIPFVSSLFANERVNFHYGDSEFGAIVENGEITISETMLADPSINVFVEEDAVAGIESGAMSPRDAMASGKARVEGVGFFSSLKVEFAKMMLSAFEPPVDAGN